MRIRVFLILCITLTLASCGFQLRSNKMLPSQLHTVTLQSSNPYGELQLALKRALIAEGVTITKDQTTPLVINVTSSEFTHDNQNMVSSAQATIYNFSYKATFTINDQKGQQIIKPQTVTAKRTVTLNPDEVLEASGEIDIIKHELQREAVFKILNHLSSQQTKQQLSLYSNKKR